MVNQLLLTEDNIENFRAVLPPAIGISPERITIGCYDEDGTVLGAMSFDEVIKWNLMKNG